MGEGYNMFMSIVDLRYNIFRILCIQYELIHLWNSGFSNIAVCVLFHVRFLEK